MGGQSSKEDEKKDEKEEEKKLPNHLRELQEQKQQQALSPDQALAYAAWKGDEDGVRRLKAAGGNVNAPDVGPVIAEGKTRDDPLYKNVIVTGDFPMHLAAEAGHEKMCELLWLLDASPECKDRLGSTPLHRAVSHGRTNVVRWFIDKKCDLFVKNNIGNTALHIAAYTGNIEIAQMLLAEGCYRLIRLPNKVEMTPLDYARRRDMQELLTRCRPDGTLGPLSEMKHFGEGSSSSGASSSSSSSSSSGTGSRKEMKHGDAPPAAAAPVQPPPVPHTTTAASPSSGPTGTGAAGVGTATHADHAPAGHIRSTSIASNGGVAISIEASSVTATPRPVPGSSGNVSPAPVLPLAAVTLAAGGPKASGVRSQE